MKKAKIVATALVASMALSMAGCSKMLKPDWHEEAKEAVAEKFDEKTCNEFWLNGEVYQFPCKAEDFTDKGWELGDKYKDKTLAPHTQSEYTYYLTNGDDKIEVGFTNNSDKELTYLESEVDYIELTVSCGKFVTAGDMELFYTKVEDYDDILDILDLDKDAVSIFDDDETDYKDYKYSFESKDGYSCYMVMGMGESQDAKRLLKVTYGCNYEPRFDDEMTAMIDSVVYNDASKTEPILTFLLGDNPDFDPQFFVDDERDYLVSFIFEYLCGFNSFSEEQHDKALEYVDFLLNKGSYKITGDNENSEVDLIYTAPDVYTAVGTAFVLSDEAFENTEDWASNPEYIDFFLTTLIDGEGTIEMLPETTYHCDYYDDYIYDTILCTIIGFGDYVIYADSEGDYTDDSVEEYVEE